MERTHCPKNRMRTPTCTAAVLKEQNINANALSGEEAQLVLWTTYTGM